MKQIAVRLGFVIVLLLVQLLTAPLLLVTYVLGLLLTVYVSSRESYLLIAGVGILLDILHWRFFGMSVTIAILLLMKLSEVFLTTKRTREVTWREISLCVLVVSFLYLIPDLSIQSPFAWLIRSVAVMLVMSVSAALLIVPAERCGEWYRKITEKA